MDRRDYETEEHAERNARAEAGVSPIIKVAALLLLLGGGPGVLVGVLWLGALSTPAPRPTDTPTVTQQPVSATKNQVYTRKDFTQLVVGKRSDEFVRHLGWGQGGHNGDQSGNGAVWIYYRRTLDPATGELDEATELYFVNGTVERVTFR